MKKFVAIIVAAVLFLIVMGIVPPGISICASVPTGYTGILTTYGRVEAEAVAYREDLERACRGDDLIELLSADLANALCKSGFKFAGLLDHGFLVVVLLALLELRSLLATRRIACTGIGRVLSAAIVAGNEREDENKDEKKR